MKLLVPFLAVATTLARQTPTELGKENFFQYLTTMDEGRNFLSTVAERIMDRT